MADTRIAATRRWLERLVIAENLCPFARRPLEAGALRFAVCEGADDDAVLNALEIELARLVDEPEVETTLLILPAALADFLDFNQFLDVGDALLDSLGLRGAFQLASFHPEYQFAGTAPADAENYSNRSPYPMLHILREDSVASAVDSHPDIEAVPAANIVRLRTLGAEYLQSLRDGCLGDD